MKRILIGGIAAGIVVFIWGFVSHMVLSLGETGFVPPRNGEGAIGALQGGLGERGVYLLPWVDQKTASEEELAAWTASYEAGPTAFIVYNPEGRTPLSPKQLGTELGTNIAACLLAAFLVSRTRAGFAGRVAFVTLLGAFAWLSISVPYWNWYGFPDDFTLAEGADQLAAFFLAGIVLASVVRPPEE